MSNKKNQEAQNFDETFLPFPSVYPVEALVVKNLPANAGDERAVGLIPGSGRSPGRENVTPLQYSCRENPMGSRTWWATAYGVRESDMTE